MMEKRRHDRDLQELQRVVFLQNVSILCISNVPLLILYMVNGNFSQLRERILSTSPGLMSPNIHLYLLIYVCWQSKDIIFMLLFVALSIHSSILWRNFPDIVIHNQLKLMLVMITQEALISSIDIVFSFLHSIGILIVSMHDQ